MINLLASALVCVAGIASQYAPGVMESTIRIRQAGHTAHALPAVLPRVNGYIAAVECADIGQVWTVAHGEKLENLLVVDCAGDDRTRNWMRWNGILVEVDGSTAARWSTVGRAASIGVCRKEKTRHVVGF